MHTKDPLPVLKALADKTRLDIIRTLVRDHDDTASTAKVRTCSSLSQPAMSHHIKKLVDANILIENKVGSEKIYELNSKFLNGLGIDPKKL